MKKSFVVGVSVLALGAVGLAWWWQNRTVQGAPAAGAKPAAERPGAKPGAPVTVEVGTIRRLRLVDEATAVGTVSARRSVSVRPEVSGRVAALGFDEGRPVRMGQLLVQLDDTLQRAQLRQAQAQEALAKSQWQRNRDLAAQNFVSQNAVDQSAAAHEVALAQVALVQAQLARMRILAPFDGLAGIRRVSVGDYVKDGADLVDVQDLSQLWIDFRLAERYLAQLKVGQTVEATLDAQPSLSFVGKIEVLDSQVEATGRALLVRARFNNPGNALKPGMFARARTIFGIRENALVAPEEALVPEGGKQFLVKVVDGEKGKVAQRIEARLGTRLDGKVEIVSGVEEGDVVVVAGQERLMRGEALPVRIVQVGAAASGAAPRAPAKPASGAASSASGASARVPA